MKKVFESCLWGCLAFIPLLGACADDDMPAGVRNSSAYYDCLRTFEAVVELGNGDRNFPRQFCACQADGFEPGLCPFNNHI